MEVYKSVPTITVVGPYDAVPLPKSMTPAADEKNRKSRFQQRGGIYAPGRDAEKMKKDKKKK